jgi:predicted nucleic acid-binding protein
MALRVDNLMMKWIVIITFFSYCFAQTGEHSVEHYPGTKYPGFFMKDVLVERVRDKDSSGNWLDNPMVTKEKEVIVFYADKPGDKPQPLYKKLIEQKANDDKFKQAWANFISNSKTISPYTNGPGSEVDNIFHNTLEKMSATRYLQAAEIEIYQGLAFKQFGDPDFLNFDFDCELIQEQFDSELQPLAEENFSKLNLQEATSCGSNRIAELAQFEAWVIEQIKKSRKKTTFIDWFISSAYAQNAEIDLDTKAAKTLYHEGEACDGEFILAAYNINNLDLENMTDEQIDREIERLQRIDMTADKVTETAFKLQTSIFGENSAKIDLAADVENANRKDQKSSALQEGLRDENNQQFNSQSEKDVSGYTYSKEFGYSYSNTPIRDSGSNAGAEQQSQNENGRGEAVVTLARQTNDELSHMARTQEQTLERIKENIRQGKRPDEGLKKMTNEELSFGRMKRMSAVLQLANGEKKFLLQEEILDKEGNVKEVIKKEPDFSDYVDYSNVDVSKRATVMATDIMTEARMRGMNFPANEVVKVANKLAQKDETSKVSMDEIFEEMRTFKIADPGKLRSEMRNLMAQKVARTAEVEMSLQDDIKGQKSIKIALARTGCKKRRRVNKWSSKVD